MTLQRDHDFDQQFLECEECSETTDTYERDEFSEMIRAAKEAGWIVRQDANGWIHTCPDCSGGGRLARAQSLFG